MTNALMSGIKTTNNPPFFMLAYVSLLLCVLHMCVNNTLVFAFNVTKHFVFVYGFVNELGQLPQVAPPSQHKEVVERAGASYDARARASTRARRVDATRQSLKTPLLLLPGFHNIWCVLIFSGINMFSSKAP